MLQRGIFIAIERCICPLLVEANRLPTPPSKLTRPGPVSAQPSIKLRVRQQTSRPLNCQSNGASLGLGTNVITEVQIIPYTTDY